MQNEKQIAATKRADVVQVYRRAGAFAVWAGTIEGDHWLVAELPTSADADGLARRLAGWFRCAARQSDGRFYRTAVSS